MTTACLLIFVSSLGPLSGVAAGQVQTSSAGLSTHAEPKVVSPLTVCEVLQDLKKYTGKMVTVVGRFSSNGFDGSWLSEDDCGLPRGDPEFPYAIFLGCFEGVRPPAIPGGLKVDPTVLEAKLNRLRRTTNLGYYHTAVVGSTLSSGEEMKMVPWAKMVRLRETWEVVFGRLQASSLAEQRSLRAQAHLCRGDGASLSIEEPEPPTHS